MQRILLAICLSLAAVSGFGRGAAASTLNLGQVISAMNTTQTVLPALQSPIAGISAIDVSQVAIPVEPCSILIPGDPCRRPSYYLAINRDASTILALRGALGQTSISGGTCIPNGDLQCTTIAQSLANQNVPGNSVVGASLTSAQLVVFYDSGPADCVIIPTEPCIPPSPV